MTCYIENQRPDTRGHCAMPLSQTIFIYSDSRSSLPSIFLDFLDYLVFTFSLIIDILLTLTADSISSFLVVEFPLAA